jgi:transcriptional regulator with XRE-family HTH domain
MMSELGEVLKKLRGKESLRDAANRIGISHTYLRILEKGVDLRSGNPAKATPETLKLISSAYDYPYPELLEIAGIIDDDLRDKLIYEGKLKFAEEVFSLPEHHKNLVIDMVKTLKEKNK